MEKMDIIKIYWKKHWNHWIDGDIVFFSKNTVFFEKNACFPKENVFLRKIC